MGYFRFSRETRAYKSVGPGYPTRAGSVLPKEAAVPGGTVPTHTRQSRPLPQSQSRQDIPPHHTGTEGGALLRGAFYLSSQNPREPLCLEAGMDVSDVGRTL